MNSVPGDQLNCDFRRDKLDHQIEAIHFHRGREWMVLQRKPFFDAMAEGSYCFSALADRNRQESQECPGPLL